MSRFSFWCAILHGFCWNVQLMCLEKPVLQKNSLLFVQLTHTVGEVAHTDCRGDVVVIVANTVGTEIKR